VLESGENTVVFHDDAEAGSIVGGADDARPGAWAPSAPRGGGWYTQKGA